ncbi:SIR2 family protein [Actinomadura alba]|uniref:SIR2 family protein n=1 Tax=Actinomadura alba TaxID=406431 RepID=A0ABR7LL73_9ACTN|nr:SIR2 family protein [Actinomadura alba]MBC6465250.1 SIR2 family protein [Actinomadura alba]
MRTVRIDELAAEILAGPRPIAVLAGAGVSDSAGVLTGQELLRRAARERGEDPGPDPVAWYLTATGGFPDYFGMVRDGSASSEALPGEPYERSSSEVLPGELYERPAPTPAHRAIAELVAAGHVGPVLTTNLDRLLERALNQVGPAVPVAFDLDAMARVSLEGPALVKLHGDYRDIGIRHTARALHTYHPIIDTLLDRVFTDFDLLVCGWSASWDLPLCDALCRTTGRRVRWLQCGPPSRAARRIFEIRKPSIASVTSSDAGLTALAAILLDQRR